MLNKTFSVIFKHCVHIERYKYEKVLEFLLGIRLNEAKNEVQYLKEVLDVSALLASKEAEFDTLDMFELILTDLKKRKQHKKLLQIAQNLIDSLERNNKNDGGDKTFIGMGFLHKVFMFIFQKCSNTSSNSTSLLEMPFQCKTISTKL